jgi:HSP20 family molecular chaperone IbpA
MNKNKIRFFLTIIIVITTIVMINGMLYSQNEYEQKFIGKWSNDQDTDLFVFENNNIVYLTDEDGIRLTENGRWRANADTLAVELQYNGKRYRLIFKYEFINEDEIKMQVVKNLVDGKEEETDENEFLLTRVK